ncbi:DUF3289 family protein [Erwinia sorbitola]|uniref:DUF3289 family protein n=1 Tax=Erwinia sorbitola TaxID=2681984 RepID=A0A6I6EHM0_9GAMM|nr:DUF3289 family protein [Erwinia sorbitola]QGU85876.1 DUF3289 family protein [Erwinia sorbitola]
MARLQYPCVLFQSQRRMDDYNSRDMQYGDLTAQQLKTHFGLRYISDQVDPYTLTKTSALNRPQSMFSGSRVTSTKITVQECAQILFDEFRDLSRVFSIYGPYRHEIGKMINHMQHGNGTAYSSAQLNMALKEHVLRDTTENSTLLGIKKVLGDKIDWGKSIYPAHEKDEFRKEISFGKLPKFDRFQDKLNGMSITVHDTWATHITLKSLQVEGDRYRAFVHYKVQDHFGLDIHDISKFKFKQFHFFRIWFLLQRYNKFGFKPFITNMEATVEVNGDRNETEI